MADDLAAAITGGIESVTKKWAKQRKAEERQSAAYSRRRQVMTSYRAVTIRDVAWEVMEESYLKASAGGTLPANARQVMYAARPAILGRTGKAVLDDDYFTQTLLPDYITEYGLETEWDVAYDARGHLVEPHAGRLCGKTPITVSLGTLDVRGYLANIQAGIGDPLAISHLPQDYPTAGPEHRYSSVLFMEKEGFSPLLAHARIAERYDLAIMSTKGMSVVAARTLIDRLSDGGVRVFVVHDFDTAGFSIAATLTGDTRRYEFDNNVDVVDLGIRLADVEAYGLVSEPWSTKTARTKVENRLRINGATAEEIGFLVRDGDYWRSSGQRVELNAFTSDQLIEWLEAELDAHQVEKVIPDDDTLTTAYRRILARHAVNAKIDEITASVTEQADLAVIPADLADRVRELLDDEPDMSWDAAVAEIADDERESS